MLRRQISFDLEVMKRNFVSFATIPPVRIWWISEPLRWRILLKTSRKIHMLYFFLDHFFPPTKGGATFFGGGPIFQATFVKKTSRAVSQMKVVPENVATEAMSPWSVW